MTIFLVDARAVITWLALLFCTFLAANLRAEAPGDIDDVQQRITTTTEQLKLLNTEIDNAKSLKDTIQTNLQKSRSALGEKDNEVNQLTQQIDQFNHQLSTFESRIGETRTTIAATRQSLSAVLRAASQAGRHSTLKILLQQDNPADAARMQAYSGYITAEQRTMIEAQTLLLQQLKRAEMALKKDRNWLNHLRRKAHQQRDNVVLATRENSEKLAQIDRELTQKTQSAEQLTKDQARLQSLMDELQSAPTTTSGYFASLKGNMALPVTNGRLNARFGDRKDVGKLRWSGLFIQADADLDVKALADGEVIYGDWLQGFGMLVILDHGDGFMSLYGGNRTVLVRAGEWVESGSTIATVGDSGGQNTSGLYLEIRHNAEAVDPEEWIRLEKS
jgi:septal ring factor EnvC (AmiA/AmiB activator)